LVKSILEHKGEGYETAVFYADLATDAVMAVMVLGKINTKEKENLEGLNFIK
jgi:hypothetical protein